MGGYARKLTLLLKNIVLVQGGYASQIHPITIVSMGRVAMSANLPYYYCYWGRDFLIGGNMGGFQKKAVIL
jgi:hypothetical protein